MAGPIQIIPRGLLGFFNLKSQGANPTQLVESVQPIIDLYPQYLEAQAIIWPLVSGVNLASGNNGGGVWSPNAIVVPNDQIWWIQSYGIFTGQLPATDDCVYSPAMRITTVGTIQWELCPKRNEPYQPSLVAPVNKSRLVTANGFFAPPGSELGFWVQSCVTATTVALTAEVRYCPMRV
jgi:hypothetical protein